MPFDNTEDVDRRLIAIFFLLLRVAEGGLQRWKGAILHADKKVKKKILTPGDFFFSLRDGCLAAYQTDLACPSVLVLAKHRRRRAGIPCAGEIND
jgi:hypothetical protein